MVRYHNSGTQKFDDTEHDSVNTGLINSTVSVETESEFKDAIGGANRIVFDDDITMSSGILTDVGSSDLVVDLNEHTLARATDHNDRQLQVTTTGRVVIKNGKIDGNRANQSDFSTGSRPAEVRIENAELFRVQDVEIIDNTGWSVESRKCTRFISNGVDVQTNPEGLGSDARGLDGIHVIDAEQTSIVGGTLEAGDDAIAIDVRDVTSKRVEISGVTASSPVHANGIKLLINTSTAGPAVRNVNINATITDCANIGFIIKNEGNSGTTIENINFDGVIENIGSSAFKNTPDDAIEDLTISGTIRNFEGKGVDLDQATNVTIDATINVGAGTGPSNVYLNDCTDVSISGTMKGSTNHAVNVTGTSTHVAVAGAVIRDYTYSPVIINGSADYVTVTGCDLDGNSVNNNNGAANVVDANNQ